MDAKMMQLRMVTMFTSAENILNIFIVTGYDGGAKYDVK